MVGAEFIEFTGFSELGAELSELLARSKDSLNLQNSGWSIGVVHLNAMFDWGFDFAWIHWVNGWDWFLSSSECCWSGIAVLLECGWSAGDLDHR